MTRTTAFCCAGLAVVALSAAKEWGPPKPRKVTATKTITAIPTNAPLTNLDGSTLAQEASTNMAGSAKSQKPPKLPIIPLAKPLPVIVRGPYLQCGTTNSVVIRWRTDTPGPSVVRFGFSPTNLNKTAASAGSLSEHVVLVRGLKPDAKYFYAIGANDSQSSRRSPTTFWRFARPTADSRSARPNASSLPRRPTTRCS